VSFAQIRDKVRAAEPLSFDDGVALYAHPNLMELGALANEVRERLHGDRTYFNRNMHINATNVCEASCRFCSFARLKEGDPAAYTMTHEEAWGRLRARVAANDPITEIHIVNGLHPGLAFDYYTELLAGLKRIQPGIHLKAFTAVEIFYFSQKFGMSIEAELQALRTAGLDSLPGGGAEISRRACARRSATTSPTPTSGWRSTASRTGWGCARTAPCSTATSRPSRSASTTCCGCARCKRRRAGSRPSSRWLFIPTTTRS
jgi:aminodeoxyfutalosine synthase